MCVYIYTSGGMSFRCGGTHACVDPDGHLITHDLQEHSTCRSVGCDSTAGSKPMSLLCTDSSSPDLLRAVWPGMQWGSMASLGNLCVEESATTAIIIDIAQI